MKTKSAKTSNWEVMKTQHSILKKPYNQKKTVETLNTLLAALRIVTAIDVTRICDVFM